jgi:hypothetical protein
MSFNGDLYPNTAEAVMSTKGDIVRYDSERERYAIGSTNQVLSVTAGLPAWKTLTTADSTLTTQGDILYEGASGLARLGFGTSGDILTTKGTGANPAWETPATGAWSQIASSNLSGGVASSLTVTGMTKKKFLDINIAGGFASADIPAIQIGDGSINTSNYAWNVTQNGAASTTGTGSEIQCNNATTGSNFYIHAYMFNNSADLNSFVGQTTSNNVSWTWTAYWNNSSQIDQLKLFGSDGGNNLATSTQIVIYGAD